MLGRIRKSYRCTIYACYLGYITQGIGNNLAPLLFLIFQAEFGFSLTEITFVVTLNFGIQLMIDLFGAFFADRLGYRICCVAGDFCSAVGLAGMAVFPFLFPSAYAGLLTAVVLYAIGGGINEVLVSPIVEACPTENKTAAMSLLHSFYCWGVVGVVLLSTLFLFVFGKGSWRILCVLWAIVPLVTSLLFVFVPINSLTESGASMSVGGLARTGLFWVLFALMFSAGASEAAMAQWASAFAEAGLGVNKTTGDILGPCLFAVFQGVTRVAFAKYSDRLDIRKSLVFSAVLCVLCYFMAALSPWPVLSLFGGALTGCAIAIMWPGVFSLASKRLPKGGTAMFALLALAGDIGCGSGPTAVGIIADHMKNGLTGGLLFAAAFPMIMVIGGMLLGKRKEGAAR